MYKDLCFLELSLWANHAAKYLAEANIGALHPTWIKIISSLLLVYTKCWRPRTGSDHNSRVKMFLNNLEGIDLNVNGNGRHDADAPDAELKPETNVAGFHVPTMMHLQNAIQKWQVFLWWGSSYWWGTRGVQLSPNPYHRSNWDCQICPIAPTVDRVVAAKRNSANSLQRT